LILPEEGRKELWAAQILTDNSKRVSYSPIAFMQDNIWYNSDQVKADEIRIYDDLLNPKWKGKIGM
jgi:ABC-type Fe3+ transport system substrate-binding protein